MFSAKQLHILSLAELPKLSTKIIDALLKSGWTTIKSSSTSWTLQSWSTSMGMLVIERRWGMISSVNPSSGTLITSIRTRRFLEDTKSLEKSKIPALTFVLTQWAAKRTKKLAVIRATAREETRCSRSQWITRSESTIFVLTSQTVRGLLWWSSVIIRKAINTGSITSRRTNLSIQIQNSALQNLLPDQRTSHEWNVVMGVLIPRNGPSETWLCLASSDQSCSLIYSFTTDKKWRFSYQVSNQNWNAALRSWWETLPALLFKPKRVYKTVAKNTNDNLFSFLSKALISENISDSPF